MAVVVVTGGTGMLGRRLVPCLQDRGHHVRALSRRAHDGRSRGVEMLQGDVRLGDGLDAAFDGADVVVHAASNPRRRARQTEVEGTRNVLRTAAASRCHVIYVSIVGVDRSRFPYYKAKRAAEELVERYEGPWTIRRSTQFHEFLDQLLGGPVFIRTPRLAFQPVAAADVAAALADDVQSGGAGHAPDIGGPEVLSIRELAEARRRVTGRAARLVPLPPVGPLRDFDAGNHLSPGRAIDGTTWEDWLRTEAV